MLKIWTIAWKDIYTRFTDRNLILIMLATPLALATIVGLAFGGLGGGDVPVQDIPIAILNADQGMAQGFNFGQVYLDLLTPAEGQDGQGAALPGCNLPSGETAGADQSEPGAGVSLLDLTDAVAFDDALARQLVSSGAVSLTESTAAGSEEGAEFARAVARAAVDQGVYTAAVFIPADFSARLNQIDAEEQEAPVQVSIYANGGRPVAAGIVRSIIDGITNQLLTGNITIAATFSQMAATGAFPSPDGSTGSLDFEESFACAFTPASNTITLETRTVQAEEQNITSIILVSVGSSQAMFFALFTAQFGIFSMYDERRNWTLQRLLTSPTPKSYILAGKLIGVFITVIVQLLLLMIALSLVGSLLAGQLTLIWGTNYLLIALALFAAALAVSGLGMLLAGVASTPEQGQVFGSVLNIAMAALGGAFGFTLPRAISAFSLLYWGRDAFDQLAAGQTDIGLNVLVLVAMGVLMYLIGLLLFNRRFKI